MVSKRRSNTIAAVGTLFVMLLIFLLLWFVTITSAREQEDEGIEVAFGVAEDGGGFQPQDVQASAPSEAVAPPPAPSQPSPNDLIVQDDEESMALLKQREEEEKARRQAEQERLQREREEQQRLEAERIAREQALAEQRAREQAAIDKANQLGSLFGNSGAGATGSGDTEGDTRRGNPEVGNGASGGTSWSLAGRSCKSLPAPGNNFSQEGKVVVAIIVDANGKVVSAKATGGTTVSDDGTIQLAVKAAYKAEFNFTDRPDKQFGTITYIFKFK